MARHGFALPLGKNIQSVQEISILTTTTSGMKAALEGSHQFGWVFSCVRQPKEEEEKPPVIQGTVHFAYVSFYLHSSKALKTF